MQIPDELVALVRERRIIPFIGAGVSAGLGLPDWEELLRDVCSRIEGADFDSLMTDTNGDLLQVAEYLYLRCDKHIGPIRHALERGLSKQGDPILSGIHVELVNLRAQQIYTTNYDDLIEDTYRQLGLPVKTVVLPKDVALVDNKKTQVVKYHGDLRHEETLVLTESAYYKRLDFESPMDLKFRSDLLGRSVLFMGYSFRDINIRIIWFKLMEMMKDIPEADRTPSYIVRAQPNEALEELYRAVGLRTIVLTNETKALSAKERTRLHADFVMTLADVALRAGGTTGARSKRWISAARLDALDRRVSDAIDALDPRGDSPSSSQRARLLGLGFGRSLSQEMKQMRLDAVPSALEGRATEVFFRMMDSDLLTPDQWSFVNEILTRFGSSNSITGYFAKTVASGGYQTIRRELLGADLDWSLIWNGRISDKVLEQLVLRFQHEISVHLFEKPDEDLAYVIDVIKRAVDGEIFDRRRLPKFAPRIEELMDEASEMYPAVRDFEPQPGAKPDPAELLKEINQRATETQPDVRRRRRQRAFEAARGQDRRLDLN